MNWKRVAILVACVFLPRANLAAGDIHELVEHGYVTNQGVKLHFVTLGKGPLIVMLHGFPDYWYTWRHQMEALSDQYQVVAVDLRGYNRSDKPKGIENYAMPVLISDIAAVINHFKQPKATVIGHDWGGAIAWQLAIWQPNLVEKLVVLSTPHPTGFIREFNNNEQQQENSTYARNFQKEDAHQNIKPKDLLSWLTDEAAKPHYLDAFNRSDVEAMLNYYKASFPKPTLKNGEREVQDNGGQPGAGTKNRSVSTPRFNNIQCPVLAVFGLQDKALLASGFNETWQWVDADLTLVSIPEAGHFIQQDASEKVSETIKTWLANIKSVNGLEQPTPHSDSPPETAQFGQFTGNWKAERKIRNRDGSWPETVALAEWHWYPILDGHAIQDDWYLVSEADGERRPSLQAVGTNIRIYDPKEKLWKMAWIDKNSRQLATFKAERQGDRLVMLGNDTRGRLSRVTFFNIQEDAFDWKKEWTDDNGASWFEIVRIRCTRE